ncbi:hypothetical protein XCR_3869 [Xanthomonas campestris pv. raphani 756C]|nr:hypothetical protein XCR_3869 [Xanthomonas campestris pv. raphani 756C]
MISRNAAWCKATLPIQAYRPMPAQLEHTAVRVARQGCCKMRATAR